MNIVTKFIYPPIPDRHHDWCAYDADLEDGAPDSTRGPTGYGETEAEALKDLISDLVEHYETAAYAEGRSDQAKDEAEMRIELLGRIRSDIQDVRAELEGSKR